MLIVAPNLSIRLVITSCSLLSITIVNITKRVKSGLLSFFPGGMALTKSLKPTQSHCHIHLTCRLTITVSQLTIHPSRMHSQPGPILTPNSLQEHKIACILDAQPCGCGYQFLIHWKGYGPKDDEWLPATLLEDCKALNRWYEPGGHGPDSARYLPPGF
jgi:hypothetical protein